MTNKESISMHDKSNKAEPIEAEPIEAEPTLIDLNEIESEGKITKFNTLRPKEIEITKKTKEKVVPFVERLFFLDSDTESKLSRLAITLTYFFGISSILSLLIIPAVSIFGLQSKDVSQTEIERTRLITSEIITIVLVSQSTLTGAVLGLYFGRSHNK